MNNFKLNLLVVSDLRSQLYVLNNNIFSPEHQCNVLIDGIVINPLIGCSNSQSIY